MTDLPPHEWEDAELQEFVASALSHQVSHRQSRIFAGVMDLMDPEDIRALREQIDTFAPETTWTALVLPAVADPETGLEARTYRFSALLNETAVCDELDALLGDDRLVHLEPTDDVDRVYAEFYLEQRERLEDKGHPEDPEGIVTCGLAIPSPGQVIFHPEASLVAEVTKVQADGFRFRVHNGFWDGAWSEDGLHIDKTGETLDVGPFRRVVSLSPDAAEKWYTSPIGRDDRSLPEPQDDLAPDM